MVEWLKPTTLKQLQPILGFCNFYHCFIRDHCRVAASLNKGMLLPLRQTWPFTNQRNIILAQLEPTWQFIIKVDTSETGVEQSSPSSSLETKSLIPVPTSLVPAQHNYDIKNSELLTMKRALEEWQHVLT